MDKSVKVEETVEKENPIFEQVHFTKSGINFINVIREDETHNFFNYNYIYNGAGLAVGDFNNDGLQDVIFVSNQSKNRLFINQGELSFENVSETSGVESDGGWKNGVTVVDVNQDGLDDIYLSRSGRYEDASKRANELYINNGDLTFTESASTYGLADKGYGVQAYFFDYDQDGDLDMYMMNHRIDFQNNNIISEIANERTIDPYAQDRLYENRKGKYVDVSKKAGINNHAWGLSTVIGDFNEDGHPDIYVANDYLTPDLLYINNQDGTFSESIEEYFPHISFFSMGSDWADIDNNGHFDLYTLDMAPEDHVRSKKLMASMSNEYFRTMVEKGLQHQYMINTLQYNHGEGNYSEVSQISGISKTDWSWTALFQDFDNDGLKDLFVTNGIRKDITDNDAMIETNRMRSEGERITLGQVMSLLPSTKLQNPIFKNEGDLHFKRNNLEWGMKQAFNSNGAITADFDNDGDLEIMLNNMDLMATVYRNLSVENQQKKSNRIKVVGPKGNREGFGTELRIKHADGVIVEQIRNSRGYLSNAEPAIYLSDEILVESVEVKWPNGEYSLVSGPLNETYELVYDNIEKTESNDVIDSKLFKEASITGLESTHLENSFDDFIKEILLPHRQSEHGPFIAKADVNADGLEDVLIGGAAEQASQLFIQDIESGFKKSSEAVFNRDAAHEDISGTFFDFDNDGDLDIYLVSGSGEFYRNNKDLLRDRIYVNDGQGNFSRAPLELLPNDLAAGSKALNVDIDKDGDEDLIVLNRNVPGEYPMGPRSFIYENREGRFANVTKDFAPDLYELEQMAVDGLTVDLDNNGFEDLVLVGEWTEPQIFLNDGEELELDDQNNFSDLKGWWRSIQAADLDNDGDLDLVLGNIGLNNKFHPKKESPLYLFYNDFDQNGYGDIVLSKSNGDELLPVRGRECSSQQMPFILDKFESYDAFANANLVSIYSEEKLDQSLKLEVNNFHSGVLWNDNGAFRFEDLPVKAQFGATNDIIIYDFNEDGLLDILTAGNFYGSEVETVRYDSHYGSVLINQGNQQFEAMPMSESGLNLKSDVRDIEIIEQDDAKTLLVVSNNDALKAYRMRK